jgi:hypothetical protein
MKRIFKYRLPRDGEIITITAHVVKWLNIQEQDGWPHIWAVVDDTGYESEYEIVAWGTGWDFPNELNHCRYMGTAQDIDGYVWHYFMQERSKSWLPAETAIATAPIQGIDYWNGRLTTTPATVQDYTETISCDDSDSAVSALKSNVYNDYTTSIDGLQGVVEYLTAAVTSSNTATVRACT